MSSVFKRKEAEDVLSTLVRWDLAMVEFIDHEYSGCSGPIMEGALAVFKKDQEVIAGHILRLRRIIAGHRSMDRYHENLAANHKKFRKDNL